MPEQLTLLVEGKNDEMVIKHLANRRGLDPTLWEVHGTNGIDNVLEVLPVQLRASNVERLAVVVDANGDAAARYAAVRQILLDANYQLASEQLQPGGVVAHGPRMRVGVG